MNQEAYSTIMSRRRVISLFGTAAGAGVAIAATLRSASAQTSGMERRDDRRDEREKRRDQRRGTTDKPAQPTGSNPTGADPIAAEAVADSMPWRQQRGEARNMPDMGAGLGLSLSPLVSAMSGQDGAVQRGKRIEVRIWSTGVVPRCFLRFTQTKRSRNEASKRNPGCIRIGPGACPRRVRFGLSYLYRAWRRPERSRRRPSRFRAP